MILIDSLDGSLKRVEEPVTLDDRELNLKPFTQVEQPNFPVGFLHQFLIVDSPG